MRQKNIHQRHQDRIRSLCVLRKNIFSTKNPIENGLCDKKNAQN